MSHRTLGAYLYRVLRISELRTGLRYETRSVFGHGALGLGVGALLIDHDEACPIGKEMQMSSGAS